MIDLRVAGAAALLIAKAHKINDRHGRPRQEDKDALDAFRLLRGTATDDLVRRIERMLADKRSAEVTKEGIELLRGQFGNRGGIGVGMAINAVGLLGDADEIAASCEVLMGELLGKLKY